MPGHHCRRDKMQRAVLFVFQIRKSRVKKIMEKRQLRVGNTVLDPNLMEVTLDYFDEDYIQISYEGQNYHTFERGVSPEEEFYNILSGVPVTERKLEALGFTSRYSEVNEGNVWSLGTFDLYQAEDEFLYATYMRGERFKGGILVKYMHHLENLFFYVNGMRQEIREYETA